MNTAPLSLGTIHLIGIGGIGMSGIAEILHRTGHKVQGSDLSSNPSTDRLKAQGIPIFTGHSAENVNGCSIVVPSSAIKETNPELQQARREGICIISRAEMLAEIMRFSPCIAIAGTHGKTTTTSLVSHVLWKGGIDPTIINGGIITSFKTNAVMGEGNWMVVEADESDGTFIKLPSTIAVVTNIEPDHMEYFKTEANLKKCFVHFANSVPFYGFSVLCIDHPMVRKILPRLKSRRHITYGTRKEAQCRASRITASADGMSFSVDYKGLGRSEHLANLFLPLHGEHNVLNALAAITIALEFGFSPETIKESLKSFEGVKRRFTKTGQVNGITVIDDYGHHPTEISAVLKAAKALTRGRVIAVVQPHRYSRLQSLLKEFSQCFGDADILILAPVYGAGEDPVPGLTHHVLAQATRQSFKGPIFLIEDPKELAPLIASVAKSGDHVICLGAGSITHWAHHLPSQLAELMSCASA